MATKHHAGGTEKIEELPALLRPKNRPPPVHERRRNNESRLAMDADESASGFPLPGARSDNA
jgi:hypothetical protein